MVSIRCLTSVGDGLYDAPVNFMSQSTLIGSYPTHPNKEGVAAFYGPSNRIN